MRAIWALLLTVGVASLGTGRAEPRAFKEYEVKAAYLYNFGKFVDWPEQAFADPRAPMTIGVLGEDPFGPALDELVRGRTLHDRPVTVRRLRDAGDAAGCHILFIAVADSAPLEAILARLRGRPVLTVGDSGGFLLRGGIVGLRLEAERVRFDIDLDAADRAGLRINSQLLKLAGAVRRRGRDGAAP